MLKSTKQKYERLIKQATLTKQDILAIKKRCNGLRFERTDDTREACAVLLENFRYNMITKKITRDHSKIGINYLKHYFFKLDGSARKGMLDNYGQPVLDIVKSFSKFRFVGFYEYDNGYGMKWYEQVWRTFDKHGNYFDYTCGYWSKVEVLEIHYK